MGVKRIFFDLSGQTKFLNGHGGDKVNGHAKMNGHGGEKVKGYIGNNDYVDGMNGHTAKVNAHASNGVYHTDSDMMPDSSTKGYSMDLETPKMPKKVALKI